MKALKFLGLGLLVLVVIVVLINLPSGTLKPEVQQMLEAQKASEVPTANLKKLVQFLKENKDQEANPEKQKAFAELMQSFKADAYTLDFVEAARGASYRLWTKEYLKNLEGKSERERLQGLEILTQFYDELLHSRTSLISFMITLASINESFEWMKTQAWSNLSEKRITAIKERAQRAVQDREALVKGAFEADASNVMSMVNSYPSPDFTSNLKETVGWFFSSEPLYRLFFDKNETLNLAFENMNYVNERVICLKEYSCNGLPPAPSVSLFSKLRNPAGKDFVHSPELLINSLKKTEFGFQKLSELSKI